MGAYTETDVQQALEALGTGTSFRKAAKQFGVPVATLQQRQKGGRPRSIAFQGRQRLSPTQEEHLAGWICVQRMLGQRPSSHEVKTVANRLLQAAGDPAPVGKHWLDAFLRRNPSIKDVATPGRQKTAQSADPASEAGPTADDEER